MRKTALVTGGNRGIGFEICRQLLDKNITVILTSRNESSGLDAIEKLNAPKDQLLFQRIDMEDPETFISTKEFISERFGTLDILINNAGINLDNSADPSKQVSALSPNYDDIMKMFEVNTVGAIRLTNELMPLLKASDDGRIVNVSSSMGQLATMDSHSIGYRLSKTGLNVMTKVFADELSNTNVKINSVSPGWVQTDMGGQHARLTVEEAVDTIIWLATEPGLEVSGKFLKDREVIDW